MRIYFHRSAVAYPNGLPIRDRFPLLGRHQHHRHHLPQELITQNGSQSDDRVDLRNNDSGRSRSICDGLQQDAARRARTSPARQHKNSSGNRLAIEGMPPVDDVAGMRIDTAPEAQGACWL